MQMEMKTRCERCASNLLPAGEAYICSFECTYCDVCAAHLKNVCPHCGGELTRRPRRLGAPLSPPVSTPEVLTRTRPWLIWVVSFGGWGLVSLTATIAIAEFYRSRGGPMEWRNTLGMECSQILPYALLTPFVFLMATRYSMQRENWVRRVSLYLAVGL